MLGSLVGVDQCRHAEAVLRCQRRIDKAGVDDGYTQAPVVQVVVPPQATAPKSVLGKRAKPVE
jgi:hypothetical protein